MTPTRLSFALPQQLEALDPPEACGLLCDAVRMMATFRATGAIVHGRFRDLPDFLSAGDLVVINTSATIPAEVDAESLNGTRLFVHFSTEIEDDFWVVEPRASVGQRSAPWQEEGEPPSVFRVADGGTIELLEHFPESTRLHLARVTLPMATTRWLQRRGRPIHYGFHNKDWPLSAYQCDDAERRAAAHTRDDHPSGREGGRHFAGRAAYRRRVARRR